MITKLCATLSLAIFFASRALLRMQEVINSLKRRLKATLLK